MPLFDYCPAANKAMEDSQLWEVNSQKRYKGGRTLAEYKHTFNEIFLLCHIAVIRASIID